MKKILLIAVVLLMTSMLVFAGGGKDKGAAAGSGEAPFIVDLKTLQLIEIINQDNPAKVGQLLGNQLRNPNPIERTWQCIVWVFPENFVDVTKYTHVTVTAKYFDADGNELAPADSMSQVVFLYEVADSDWHGPSAGPGPNTPFKEGNLMGFSGMVHKDRGSRHGMNRAPKGILIQRAQDRRVLFIELTSIVFHNRNYDSGAEVSGSGPEGS